MTAAGAGGSTSGAVRSRLRWNYGAIALLSLVLVLVAGMFASASMALARRHLLAIEDLRSLESATDRMLRDATRYRDNAPRDYPDYWRDTTIYYRQLRDDLARIDAAMARLAERGAEPQGFMGELLGAAGARRVDDAERTLMHAWGAFRTGLHERLGPDPDEPRLEWAAIHIVQRAEQVRGPLEALADESARLLDARLGLVQRIGTVFLPALFATVLAALGIAVWRLYRRMRATLDGCSRIARGQFGLTLPVGSHDEMGVLAESINDLSRRTAAILGAISAIQSARDQGETLAAVRQALEPLAPSRSLGLYQAIDHGCARLVGASPSVSAMPRTLAVRDAQGDAETSLQATSTAALRAALRGAGLDDSLAVSLPQHEGQARWLVFASHDHRGFDADIASLLDSIAPVLAHGLDKSALTERLLLATVGGLAALAESRDPETGDHLIRMSRYSRILAETLMEGGAAELDHRRIELIEQFAPMHDIGKVGVADAILRKPGRLDDDERAAMQLHPMIGGAVLRACQAQLPERHRDLFDIAIQIAEGHHERYDGGGYPRGLAGEAIPLPARIVAVADVLDALSTRRPYKDAWPLDSAFDYLRQHAGAHFDPRIVAAAFAARDRIAEVHARHADEPPAAPGHARAGARVTG